MTIARHGKSLYALAVSADGAMVASSSVDKTLRLTDTFTGETRARIHLGSAFNYSVDFSPDGQHVLSSSKTVSVFRTDTGKRVVSCKGHKHDIRAARFSPDGTRIATGSGSTWIPPDFSVRVWDAATGKQLSRVDLDDGIQSLAWVDDHRLLVMTAARLVYVDTRTSAVTDVAPLSFSSLSMDYCRVTEQIIVAREYGASAVLIGNHGSITLDPGIPKPRSGNRFTKCAARPDGQGFVTGTLVRDHDQSPSETCYVVNWDAAGKEISRSVWHGGFLHALACSTDGKVYSGDSNGELNAWHISDGSPVVLRPPAKPKKKSSKAKTASAATRPLFIYSDALGVTRIDFKKSKVSLKTTTAFAAPRGQHAIAEANALLLVDGRIHMSQYDDGAVHLLNLPGLGKRAKLSLPIAPAALLPGESARLVQLLQDALTVSAIRGDQTVELRRLSLERAPRLAPLSIGPARNYNTDKPDYDVPAEAMLTVAADGSFAGLVDDVLYGGRLAASDDDTDALWWACPLTLHPTTRKSITASAGAVRLAVLDHAESRATILTLDPDGGHTLTEAPSLCLPAWTDELVAYQPSSDSVVYRDWKTGVETTYDVSAHNAHPHEAPEASFYKDDPSQYPASTRLAGVLCADLDRVLWLPWHREVIVDPVTQESFSRELSPVVGSMRRGVMEIIARDNASLATLQMEMGLGRFEMRSKWRQCAVNLLFPRCPSTFAYELACSATSNMTERFELRTHGWGWGSFGRVGGPRYVWNGTADIEDTLSCLRWMQRAGLMPSEINVLLRRYTELLGIPNVQAHTKAPLTHEAERLWLRALLETLARRGSWDGVTVARSWAEAPIPDSLLRGAIAAIPDWQRTVPRDGIHHLSCLLAHYMGVDALPFLLQIFALPATANRSWQQTRDAGELVVWLCHHHPDHKDSTIAALEQLKASGARWEQIEQQTLDALRAGRRHFWSNG